ncbi:M20/M25/M40 family metallo-hydrolase [Ureibacillus manganicus]|uniref:M20/M25/M40 family metallo-hydrolase n=1 Tax=Ureibacillus manganicus TaxID=1266064 RepID=UPI00055CA5FA|nr:M20/M25/M40 family metallo-hydrolase [Ureibacillus manganicus]
MGKTIKEIIYENRDLYKQWLIDFCAVPSVAAQNRGMEDSKKFLQNLFDTYINEKVEFIETSGYPVAYSHIEADSPYTISFYNHYDVQPEDPIELWNTPPFEATEIDGKIYARGIADNKGNLIARLAAVHAMKQQNPNLPINVKFIFEGEEEIGSINLAEFAENHADKIQSDGNVWEFGYRDVDDRLQVSLGVKGMLYVELSAEGANTDLHSANATIIESPAWKLLFALTSLKDQNDKILIPGFYDDVIEPTSEEIESLSRYLFDEEANKEQLGISKFVNDLTGLDLKRKHLFEPTCNICGINSGYTGEGSKTVLPNHAFAKIDFRLVPGQDPNRILKLLREHLDNQGFQDIKIKDMSGVQAARTHPTEAIVEAVIETVTASEEMAPNIVPNTPGTGPMYDLCQRYGIPSVSFGVGHYASRNHAPNENIRVQDFYKHIEQVADLIVRFEQKLKSKGVE